MADDLNTPLGAKPQPARKSRGRSVLLLLAGVLGAVYLGGAGWVLLTDAPLGGEPVITAAIDRSAPPPAAQPDPPAATNEAAVIQPQQPSTNGGPLIIKIPPSQGGGGTPSASSNQTGQIIPAAPDEKLMESSRQGMLPRVGEDGRRPADVYARAGVALDDTRPKIALLIGGLGISSTTTMDAISALPPEITLGFAPYGADLARLTARARGDGHELMLQVPMEPFDYPNNDPGPQTLLTKLPPAANIDRLHWIMSRFPGYVGLANYMGARFISTEAALTPILTEASRRGLMFLDDGSSPRSLVQASGPKMGLPVGRADLEIDAQPTPKDIDAALSRLEDIARQKGSAIGVGTALPVTLNRVAEWARAMQQRGFVLVPVSSLVKQQKAS